MSELQYEYLSDKDKNDIIVSHIKNHEYTIYGMVMNKIQLSANTVVDESVIANIDSEIADIYKKIEVLKLEQAKLVLG